MVRPFHERRDIIDGNNRDRHRDHVAVAGPIVDVVSETVRPVEMRIGGVTERSVLVEEERTVSDSFDDARRHDITIHLDVVTEHPWRGYGERPILQDRILVIDDHGGIIHRGDADLDRIRRDQRTAGAVPPKVIGRDDQAGLAFRVVEVRRRHEHESFQEIVDRRHGVGDRPCDDIRARLVIESQRAVVCRQGDGDIIACGIHIANGQRVVAPCREDKLAVLIDALRQAEHMLRSVVDGAHCDRDGRRIRVQLAVICTVRETVDPVEVKSRCVREGAVRTEIQFTVRWWRHQHGGHHVTIGVTVIQQDTLTRHHCQNPILVEKVGITSRNRRGIRHIREINVLSDFTGGGKENRSGIRTDCRP